MALPQRVPLSAPTFDLETWVTNYDGILLPRRLIHIAIHCPALSTQAISLARREILNGRDVSLYQRLIQVATELKQDIEIDTEWISRQEEANRRELTRLESELRGYKNNLIRESIRMGQEDLATHLLITGGPPQPPVEEGVEQNHGHYGLAAAYTAFGKMREHNTTPGHRAGMMLRQLFTALVQTVAAQQNGHAAGSTLQTVNTHAMHLRGAAAKDEEQARLTPIGNAASGIAHLGQTHYKEACLAFLSVPFDISTNGPVQGFDFCRLIASANDIAVYGGLTALATLSRADLNEKVLGGTFRTFLELEPHVRKAITLFTTGKYRACLDTLQRYHSDWSLDIFLASGLDSTQSSHVDHLFALIREKSITAYFQSFSQVSLTSLATTFPPKMKDSTSAEACIQKELITMIEAGTLDARLDIVDGNLVSPLQDRRISTQNAAVDTAIDLERTLLQRLNKVNVALARVEIVKQKAWPQHMTT